MDNSLPPRFNLSEFDALAALPPVTFETWSMRQQLDGRWTLLSTEPNGMEHTLAHGLPEWLATWLVEAPPRVARASDAIEDLLFARELLRVHLRRANPLVAHQLDNALDMADEDWESNVASEAERWLWAAQ